MTRQPGSQLDDRNERAGDGDEQVVRTWLAQAIARVSKMPVNGVDTSVSFAYYGLDSLQCVDLTVQLESWLGREVPPTAAYDFPSIDLLARYVTHELDKPLPHAVSPDAWTKESTTCRDTPPVAVPSLTASLPVGADACHTAGMGS